MKHSKFGKKYSLTLLTCVTACLAFIMLCISISTDNWLSTFERESDDNGTTITAIHSGLWRQCKQSRYITGVTKKTTWNDKMKTFPTNELVNCSYIKYFKGKQGGLSEIKPPEAILSDMQPAAFFPTTGLLGLLTGCILSFLSYCDQKVKKLIFVGGGLFVLSGIFMLVGIVLYVGSISQAFDSTAGNLDSEEKYVYDYGGSFYFTVISFILTEFSGIFAIYLYVARHRHYLRLKREKVLARSQSVNSCIGLVPSVSRFSFETPQEQLVANSATDLSLVRKKTVADWCPSNHCPKTTQWQAINGHSKSGLTSGTNFSQSHEKLFRMPEVGAIKPTFDELHTEYTLPKPMTRFYEDEIGETSFGYYPRNGQEERVFYDNRATTYYIESQPTPDDVRHTLVVSPDRSILSNIISPRHYSNNQIATSSVNQLRNIHILTSPDDDTISMNDKLGNHCICAQTDYNRSILLSPPMNVVLPQSQVLSGVSSRKITSV